MNIENELKDVFKDIIRESDSSSKYAPICMLPPKDIEIGKMFNNLVDRFPIAIACALSENFIDSYIKKLSGRKITVDGISIEDVLNIAKELVIDLLEFCLYPQFREQEDCENFLKKNLLCIIKSCMSCITFLERTHMLNLSDDSDKTDFCILLISMIYAYSRVRLSTKPNWR